MSDLCKPARVIPGILCSTLLLVTSLSDTGSATPFTAADFEGTWHLCGLGVRDNSGAWAHGTYTFDATGEFEGAYTSSTGHSEAPHGTMSINTEGIVRALSGVGPLVSSFHGAMSNSRNVIVCTHTGGDYSHGMLVFVKAGTAFATGDLQGTWVYHGLTSGEPPDARPGWYHGSVTINESGQAIYSAVTDSQGQNDYVPNPAEFSVDPNGIVAHLGARSFHGAVNQARDMIVATGTMAPGRDTSVRGYNLLIMVKQAPGAYAIGDLIGTWHIHGLVSGSYSDWRGWYYFSGFAHGTTFSWIANSYVNCKGDTVPAWSGEVNITSDGIVTYPHLSRSHGILSIGRDFSVGTVDDGGGGYGLLISVGRPALDLDLDGDIDFADFAVFANRWLR